MRAAKVQASLRVRAVSPEPSLLAHTSSESRGTFRQTARFLAPLNGWACAVKICQDRMLEDTNSLDRAQMKFRNCDKRARLTQQGDSNEYPQHTFLWRTYLFKKLQNLYCKFCIPKTDDLYTVIKII